MGAVFRISLRQLISPWRLVLILFLAFLPTALASLLSTTVTHDQSSNEDFINLLLDGLLITGILPIVMMVLATASFGNDLEDRTLSYLVLKPLPRSHIVLPKLMASIAVGGPMLIASGLLAMLLGTSNIGASLLELDNDVQAIFALGLALFAGVVTYGAIFTWAGLISTRALAFSLIYVFLWEGLLSTFVGGVRYISVRGYTLAILHGMDDKSFAPLNERVIELPAALVGVAITSTIFILLTLRRLRSMDIS